VSTPAIGVIFHPKFPLETLAEFARRAEAAGFDELWLWDDCFLPGAFTSTALALASTQRIKVGIGLLPATAHNALFAAMEITTLSRIFPDRLLPGFGHGVERWMQQIGAAPKSTIKALEETVTVVRALLGGETISMQGEQIRFDNVRMNIVPERVPPLYVGAIREKTLRLAGRLGDGTILTALASPTYVRWAREHIAIGMAEAGRNHNRLAVYLDTKVSADGTSARKAMRKVLVSGLRWADVQLKALGIDEEAQALVRDYGVRDAADRIPDAWVDALSAAGTPEQAAASIGRLAEAGADSIILQPLDGDPACLDEYIQLLMPLLKPQS